MTTSKCVERHPALYSGFSEGRRQYDEATCSAVLDDLHKASEALDFLRSCAAASSRASSANAAEFDRLANELRLEIDMRLKREKTRFEKRPAMCRSDTVTEILVRH